MLKGGSMMQNHFFFFFFTINILDNENQVKISINMKCDMHVCFSFFPLTKKNELNLKCCTISKYRHICYHLILLDFTFSDSHIIISYFTKYSV